MIKLFKYGTPFLIRTSKQINNFIYNFLWKTFTQAFPSFLALSARLQPTIHGGQKFSVLLEENMPLYLSEKDSKDKKLIKHLTIDMLKCYYLYGINPEEYLIHNFKEKDNEERKAYLSKKSKDEAIMEQTGNNAMKAFIELKDKYKFYQIARSYFHREACGIYSKDDESSFADFCTRHKKFFAKPIQGRYGWGSRIIDLYEKGFQVTQVFNDLLENGSWIVEELIKQDERMGEWNVSSVNTIRIPSFRTADGIKILYPFIRMGRKGSIVDNAGSGGIMTVVDAETGIIYTDAKDELGHVFATNPDNGKVFKGWQVPEWEALISLSKKVHESLPEYHKYVGFDFALTKKHGWVLVEGNWGDFICQQACLEKGLKEEFLSLIQS